MLDEDPSIRSARNLAVSRKLILQSKHFLELSRALRSQTIRDIEASREHLARLHVREARPSSGLNRRVHSRSPASPPRRQQMIDRVL